MVLARRLTTLRDEACRPPGPQPCRGSHSVLDRARKRASSASAVSLCSGSDNQQSCIMLTMLGGHARGTAGRFGGSNVASAT